MDKDITYEIPPLDPTLRKLAIIHLQRVLDDDIKRGLRAAIAIDPKNWWVLIHFGFGMALRNRLREIVLDEKLPTKNWDDYYVGCVEEAVQLSS